MMQYKSNKTWIIEFDEGFDDSSLFNQCLQIEGSNAVISDSCSNEKVEVTLSAVLRTHWLPTCESKNSVCTFLTKNVSNLNVLSIEKEFYKEEELKNVSNGILRIKVKYRLESHETLLSLIGINFISGH